MFQGFQSHHIEVSPGLTIHALVGGSGPPVLLLHGYPQTHACWHVVAPRLVQAGMTVVVPDLRGYGDSSKPVSTKDHATYSKRSMAADQVALMDRLGYSAFFVAGHDRGARVAHRMALDWPQCVQALAVLDISPTATMYGATDLAFATRYYHWFFLIQPSPLPERLIAADADFFLNYTLSAWSGNNLGVFHPQALAEYQRCFSDPDCIAASCEDYRAAATIDLEHDANDIGRRLEMPLLVLWGQHGVVGRLFDPVANWQEKAWQVSGWSLPCWHFLPEEAPQATAEALIGFFRQ
jgi:haloacetate dehalogenase